MSKKTEELTVASEELKPNGKNIVATNMPVIKPNLEEKLKDLSGKSLKELLTIKNSVVSLIEYYDNFAKANTGNYPFDTREIYDNARNLSLKYGRALVQVINAIKDKTDEELYA